MKNSKRKAVMLASHLFVIFMMICLFRGAFGYVNAGAQADAVTYVDTMTVSVNGGPEETVTLPHSFQPLEPRTPVTLPLCPTFVGQDDLSKK